MKGLWLKFGLWFGLRFGIDLGMEFGVRIMVRAKRWFGVGMWDEVMVG